MLSNTIVEFSTLLWFLKTKKKKKKCEARVNSPQEFGHFVPFERFVLQIGSAESVEALS